MQITILTMPLVIAEYLPRPSALDARPAFGRAVPTETLTGLIGSHSRLPILVREKHKSEIATRPSGLLLVSRSGS